MSAPGRRRLRVRDVLRLLRRDGWVLDRQRGSHRVFRHPARAGSVTVPGHLGEIVQPGTMASIMRQAGWR